MITPICLTCVSLPLCLPCISAALTVSSGSRRLVGSTSTSSSAAPCGPLCVLASNFQRTVACIGPHAWYVRSVFGHHTLPHISVCNSTRWFLSTSVQLLPRIKLLSTACGRKRKHSVFVLFPSLAFPLVGCMCFCKAALATNSCRWLHYCSTVLRNVPRASFVFN